MSYPLLRLSEFEIESIKSSFAGVFYIETDHLWLFGSRTNMNARGGDIDLYIETNEEDSAKIIDLKLKFLVNLKGKIGEQKIDVVINMVKSGKVLPIYEEGRKGVQLL